MDKSTDVLAVNLLPERERAQVGHRARMRLVGTGVIILIVCAIGASVTIRWRTNVEERALQLIVQDTADVERQMVQRATNLGEALAYQQRSRVVQTLLEQHTRWLGLLAFLEETTSREVYYFSMEGNRKGNVHHRAHAQSFRAAADQLASFARDPRVRRATISAVEATGVSTTETLDEEVSFEITLELDPRVMTPELKSPGARE